MCKGLASLLAKPLQLRLRKVVVPSEARDPGFRPRHEYCPCGQTPRSLALLGKTICSGCQIALLQMTNRSGRQVPPASSHQRVPSRPALVADCAGVSTGCGLRGAFQPVSELESPLKALPQALLDFATDWISPTNGLHSVT